MSHDSSPKSPEAPRASSKADKYDLYDANIRNFAPVARIMKNALPENAKIAKEAKECMQECVSEFISFITSEGKLELLDPPPGGVFVYMRGRVTGHLGAQMTDQI